MNSEVYANKFVGTLLFSKVLRLLAKKSTDVLSHLCAVPKELYRETFISIKLSLPLRKVVFFGIDAWLYSKGTYSKFLYKVDPAVKVLDRTLNFKPRSTTRGNFFTRFLVSLTERKKKQARAQVDLVKRGRKSLSLRPRMDVIYVRLKK